MSTLRTENSFLNLDLERMAAAGGEKAARELFVYLSEEAHRRPDLFLEGVDFLNGVMQFPSRNIRMQRLFAADKKLIVEGHSFVRNAVLILANELLTSREEVRTERMLGRYLLSLYNEMLERNDPDEYEKLLPQYR